MSAHSKPAQNAKSAEKTTGRPDKIAGKEGAISGIRKPKHRLRRLKLAAKNAAAAVAIAAGLAATAAPAPASAKAMSSLTGMTDISLSLREAAEPDGYMIQVPEEFAPFPEGQSVSGRSKSLAQSGKDLFVGKTDGGKSVFELKGASSGLRVFAGSSTVEFRSDNACRFSLDFSAYGMENPVARMEIAKDGKIVLHLLDAKTGTDLTLSFPASLSLVEQVKAKAYREGAESTNSRISGPILKIVDAAEKMLEAQRPKTIEEAHGVYSEMGAEMVNLLREECSAAAPGEAAELAKRGQAVITAVLLRLYLSDDENALTELDGLRSDPGLDKKTLESFAWKNGILEEFQKIWPQCSADYEE